MNLRVDRAAACDGRDGHESWVERGPAPLAYRPPGEMKAGRSPDSEGFGISGSIPTKCRAPGLSDTPARPARYCRMISRPDRFLPHRLTRARSRMKSPIRTMAQ